MCYFKANPPGVHVSFTVVVSFHISFITKVDRAYHIECAYEESDRTVTTQIDVRFVYKNFFTSYFTLNHFLYAYNLANHPLLNLMVLLIHHNVIIVFTAPIVINFQT